MDDTMKLILKLLYLARSEIRGSTMMQKIIYILKNEYENQIPELRDLTFKLHFYGPFCREISKALDDLSFHGMLSTQVEQVIDYLRYRYSLTDTGRNLARDLYESDDRQNILQRMARRVEELNRRSLQSVISEAYQIAESNGL